MTDPDVAPPTPDSDDPRAFGYVAGWLPLVSAIVIALAVETLAVHLLVNLFAPPIAFLFSALSIATIGWLIADAWSARSRPILVTRDVVHIAIGLRWTVDVPRPLIVSVERSTKGDVRGGSGRLNLAMDGQANVEIGLRAPVTVRGPFGQSRDADRLALGVDDPAAFQAAISPA